jgi:pyruvate formate lyase activating enzyme
MSESFQDNEEGLTSVIFTPGCNFSCPACHAKKVLFGDNQYNQEAVLERLGRRARSYDLKRLTITGGEPTLQPDLIDFLEKVKAIGIKVKLDTNGNKPEVLEELLENKLVDSVAMDIKGPPRFYNQLTGARSKENLLDLEKIRKSILTTTKFPDYEFRTTIVPVLIPMDSRLLTSLYFVAWENENVKEMAKLVLDSGGKSQSRYYLQQFNSREKGIILDDRLSKEKLSEDMQTTPEDIMQGVYKTMKEYFPNVKIR